MNIELTTNEHGERSRVESNIEVAVQQGRISEAEGDKYRRTFDLLGYEGGMEALLRRKPRREVVHQATASRAKSYSEAAWEDYAVRTGVVKPWERHGGYVRSVV